eukprot:TRINITY_DN33672_c0_g1_i1.p1 TRINITY_DN33672_c0_g1~~TRINITY_DN33672_c0_g1_i1.p1  ORF type:complete len:125 (-),score=24.10 TRINITY_DN33672_c0_g1_i1:113-487(-)
MVRAFNARRVRVPIRDTVRSYAQRVEPEGEKQTVSAGKAQTHEQVVIKSLKEDDLLSKSTDVQTEQLSESVTSSSSAPASSVASSDHLAEQDADNEPPEEDELLLFTADLYGASLPMTNMITFI